MARQTRLALLLVLALVAAACGGSEGTTGPDPTTIPDPTVTTAPVVTTPPVTTATPTPSAGDPTSEPTVEPTAAPEARIVNVYWMRDAALASGGRSVATSATATAAIEALLAGPDPAEQGHGMESALPSGVELLGISITDGTAIVDLSPEFESVSFGTFGELSMVAQVVFTATQFPTVDAVDIRIGGEEREVILSHGLEARGLTRSGFYDAVAPGIVVERPIPGEQLNSPFTVSGFSRTFESNVQWELTLPAGETVVASGFTTAQQPDVGVHGPFELTVGDLGGATGDALLTVFEESARDGSRVNVYEVPITVTG